MAETPHLRTARDDAERRVLRAIDRHRDAAIALAREIHADPETAFAEHRAAERLGRALSAAGFAVSAVDGLPTAFRAVRGEGPFTVGLCLEYDALPGIGHACGHHLIAGSGLLAALALADVGTEQGLRIVAVGTPAEEAGGGKALLLDRGAFSDVDIALMWHPAVEGVSNDALAAVSLAVGRFAAEFHGRAAHASASPEEGRNAADAAVVAQVAIGLLRQQLRPADRIALFVAEGGTATNVIPARTRVEFECRSDSLAAFEALQERVRRCFRAGALATGTTVAFTQTQPVYEPLVQDPGLAAAWNDAIARLGYRLERTDVVPLPSTDMGNVSRRVRALHPLLGIPGATASPHSAAFREASASPVAEQVLVDGAVALSWTALAAAR